MKVPKDLYVTSTGYIAACTEKRQIHCMHKEYTTIFADPRLEEGFQCIPVKSEDRRFRWEDMEKNDRPRLPSRCSIYIYISSDETNARIVTNISFYEKKYTHTLRVVRRRMSRSSFGQITRNIRHMRFILKWKGMSMKY